MWNDRGLEMRGAFQSAPPISGSKIMKVRIKKFNAANGTMLEAKPGPEPLLGLLDRENYCRFAPVGSMRSTRFKCAAA